MANTKDKNPALLIPIDFKIYCLKAIDYGKKLSEKIGAKIHLIHVIESQSWWDSYFNSDELIKAATHKLNALRAEQQLPDDTEIKVIAGKPYSEIEKYAKTLNARHIILSDNYPLAKGGKVIGSTLSQVIIKAEQPVISITNTEESICNRILVPIDLNQSARIQLYNSVAMALNYNSTIHLVSVLFGHESVKSTRIQEKIDKYAKVYEENGIDHKVELLVKEEKMAYKEIIKYAEKNAIDAILLMTHNEASSFDNYLGAFAQRIINEATMPVITINNASGENFASQLKVFLDPLGITK